MEIRRYYLFILYYTILFSLILVMFFFLSFSLRRIILQYACVIYISIELNEELQWMIPTIIVIRFHSHRFNCSRECSKVCVCAQSSSLDG